MSTITKERAQQIFLGNGPEPTASEERELARIALASLEAEKEYKHHSIIAEQLDHVLSSMDATDHQRAVISCAVDRLNNVSQLLQASPSALLVPETLDYQGAKELFNYLMNEEETNATVNGWNACRAAMLQGAEQQNRQQNIPENIPATQFKPVADLYGLTSPTGGETSFTFDAVEARDFIDGGWSCQEYVELERFQEAITNHTEDKLAMVDHSGDSNNMVEPVTTAYKLRDAVEIIRNSGIEIDAEKIFAERDALNAPDCWCRACRPITLTDMRFVVCPDCGNKRCPHANDHRNACSGSNEPGQEGSAYPAAPQQDVRLALEIGMSRYAGAMQKLVDSGD